MATPPGDRKKDDVITEQICELKRGEVKQMARGMIEFRQEFNHFKESEFKDMQTSLNNISSRISDVCNEVGNQAQWQRSHESSHRKNTKTITLVVQVGSWVLAAISMILLFLSKTGMSNTP